MTQKPTFKRISHIGLVVRSVKETAKRCWEDFGIGPWTFYTFDPSCVQEMTLRGKRIDHSIRIGTAMIGDIEWEIIEPLDDRSIYSEHLKTRGEGLHHIMFDVENYAAAKAHLSQTGSSEIVSGKWHGHPYSYFDVQNSLACLAEIWSPPAAGTELPPPDGTFP
jgi:methylmalonyl-CoA/ethylmalonyl-CoA epimerase